MASLSTEPSRPADRSGRDRCTRTGTYGDGDDRQLEAADRRRATWTSPSSVDASGAIGVRRRQAERTTRRRRGPPRAASSAVTSGEHAGHAGHRRGPARGRPSRDRRTRARTASTGGCVSPGRARAGGRPTQPPRTRRWGWRHPPPMPAGRRSMVIVPPELSRERSRGRRGERGRVGGGEWRGRGTGCRGGRRRCGPRADDRDGVDVELQTPRRPRISSPLIVDPLVKTAAVNEPSTADRATYPIARGPRGSGRRRPRRRTRRGRERGCDVMRDDVAANHEHDGHPGERQRAASVAPSAWLGTNASPPPLAPARPASLTPRRQGGSLNGRTPLGSTEECVCGRLRW